MDDEAVSVNNGRKRGRCRPKKNETDILRGEGGQG